MGQRVRLVAHRDSMAVALDRVLERRAHDPLDALVRVQVLVDRHFVRRPPLKAPANVHVGPLGVLAEHYHVDAALDAVRPRLERAEGGVEQLDRPQVDVQVEAEAEAEQDVPRVLVPRNAGIAERAEEDRVRFSPEPAQLTVGQRLARGQVAVGAPRQILEGVLHAMGRAGELEGPARDGQDLWTHPVAGKERDPDHATASARAATSRPFPTRPPTEIRAHDSIPGALIGRITTPRESRASFTSAARVPMFVNRKFVTEGTCSRSSSSNRAESHARSVSTTARVRSTCASSSSAPNAAACASELALNASRT